MHLLPNHLCFKTEESENIPCGSTPPSHLKWDVTSRRNLKTKRHPALIGKTQFSMLMILYVKKKPKQLAACHGNHLQL